MSLKHKMMTAHAGPIECGALLAPPQGDDRRSTYVALPGSATTPAPISEMGRGLTDRSR